MRTSASNVSESHESTSVHSGTPDIRAPVRLAQPDEGLPHPHEAPGKRAAIPRAATGPVSRAVGLALSLALALVACGTPAGPPAAPENVAASPGPGYVTVTWQDVSSNETGFRVYRSLAAFTPAAASGPATAPILPAQEPVELAEVAANESEYVDLTAEVGVGYAYAVSAMGAGGESATTAHTGDAATIEPGTDLMVGTLHRRSGGTGTVVVVYLVFPDAVMQDPAVTIDYEVTGPPGWNAGQTIGASLDGTSPFRTLRYVFLALNGQDAVSGEYSVTVDIGAATYEATATLQDAEYAFGLPTQIDVSSATSSGASVAWDAPAGTQSAWVSLWTGDYQQRLAPYVRVMSSSHVFEGLTLDDGLYLAEVSPLNTNVATYPVKVEPFGMSYDVGTFAVGDAVSSLCSSSDQAVSIPDAELQAAIRAELKLTASEISCADMALLTNLEARNAGIASLEGIQYALNLEGLWIPRNQIGDLSPLANLQALEGLDLNSNAISDLAPLANLTGLRSLHVCCDANTITSIAPLAGLTALEQLNIGGHLLGDISILADFDNLSDVWIFFSELDDADLTVLHDKDLRLLNIETNNATDISFVSAYTNLEELFVGENPLIDASLVEGLDHLTGLGIHDLGYSDIGFLADFTSLEHLDISANQIVDLTPLTGLLALRDLYMRGNLATDLSALVANAGLADGDFVDVRENMLDLSPGSAAAEAIATLDGRGVVIEYEPQSAGAP